MEKIIRAADKEKDLAPILAILHEIMDEGMAFEFDGSTSDSDLAAYWFHPQAYTYVCTGAKGEVLGFYSIKPNHTGRGGHVANAGYAVAKSAKGLGIGQFMGEHSLVKAKQLGFKAMQFNIVVSTNTAAVALWQKIGFKIVGTVPQGFDHATRGLVDIYVMHRFL